MITARLPCKHYLVAETPGVMFKFLKSVTLMNQALSDSEDEEEEA